MSQLLLMVLNINFKWKNYQKVKKVKFQNPQFMPLKSKKYKLKIKESLLELIQFAGLSK